MSKYFKIRQECYNLLSKNKDGEYITEPEQLAAYFHEDISFIDFIQNVYNKKIASLLEVNKITMKANLRTRWFLSRQFKANETLYKLLANSDELQRLKGDDNHIDQSGSDPLLEAINPQEIWNDNESDQVQ